MPRTQTAASHAAIDVVTHFILGPLFMVNVVVAIVAAVHARHHLGLHIWLVVVSILLFLVSLKMRLYTLRIQDRLIRLEERLRIAALAPTVEVNKFTMPQFIALRFASDEELPALAARTLAENLESKAIKSQIKNWRPDYARI